MVFVVPAYTANCPAMPADRPLGPAPPAGYLGEVDLFGRLTSGSPEYVTAKRAGRPLTGFPAGSFEAELTAKVAHAFLIQGSKHQPRPVFVFWDEATHALIVITGPESANLAAEVRGSLRSG